MFFIDYFCPQNKKNSSQCCKRLSFDPSENLENSKYKGEKSESCFSCSSIYTARSVKEPAHIYTCRCELISFLLIRVFQDLQTKDVRRLTLFVYFNTIKAQILCV